MLICACGGHDLGRRQFDPRSPSRPDDAGKAAIWWQKLCAI
jgi:hypothetical protein